MKHEGIDQTSLYVVCNPDGTIEGASEGTDDWLDHDRRGAIHELVRECDDNSHSRHHRELSSTELRAVRLDGSDGARYLVSVVPAGSSKAAEGLLTPRQSEVAEFAASGATVDEIADHLDISRNTVKYHLKMTYRRLGVSTRLELADALNRLDGG